MGGPIEYNLPIDPALEFVQFEYPYVGSNYPNWPQPGPTGSGSKTAVPFLTFGAGPTATTGADYGTDTPGTKTSGAQECMNALNALGGGTAYGLQGDYTFSSTIYFPGPYIEWAFEPGSSLTFADGLTGIVPAWADPSQNTTGAIIYMGSNPTGATPTIWEGQRFVPNGLQIDWGINDQANTRGIHLRFPGSSSATPYTGAGGSGWYVGSFYGTNRLSGCVEVLQENAGNTNVSYATMPTDILLEGFTYTPPSTSNPVIAPSFLFIRGGKNGMVRGVTMDNSQFPLGDNDPVNITGSYGEVFGWLFEGCTFRSNGATGQCGEIQGNARGGPTGGVHDITFRGCVFDGGSMAAVAGSGGFYIDDNILSGSTAGGWFFNLSFIDCVFNTGVTLAAAGLSITPGASPYSLTNTHRHPRVVHVTGGTVSAVTINGNPTGLTNGVFLLAPQSVLQITYSVAPTINVQGFGFIRCSGSPTGTTGIGTFQWIAQGGTFPKGRGPGTFGQVIGTPSSGAAYPQPFATPCRFVAVGGTVTALSLNGTPLPPGTPIVAQPGDQITWTYTAAPTIYVQPV